VIGDDDLRQVRKVIVSSAASPLFWCASSHRNPTIELSKSLLLLWLPSWSIDLS